MSVHYKSISKLLIHILQLQIDGCQYAAKKLINVGKGLGVNIDITTSVRVLSADLIRLKRMDYFAKRFVQAALECNVHIAGWSFQ